MEAATKKVFAQNLASLMASRNMSQSALAQKSGVSQRTISNMLNPDYDPRYSPTLNNIEKVADALGISPWQLLIEAVPTEVIASRDIEKLVHIFSTVSEEGRDAILSVGKREVRYQKMVPPQSDTTKGNQEPETKRNP
ncbi:helix-turn-helix domain-containing protein [Acidithiobacillus thiooxidans]|uniref:helix-turn-helix domain-containing protein n=1 Tax=Acidithiobacillus thiooxidans TaxID=930 RepID=UPI0035621243